MNKKYTLLASAILLGLSYQAAQAQSTLTLYGRLNTTFEWQSQKNSRTVTNVTNGVGAQDTDLSYSQKFSGITQRNNESRYGLDGTEELGEGWKARFAIEQGFNSDTGGGGSTADRKAWIGLSNEKFGDLRLGYGGGSSDLAPFFQQFDDNTLKLNDDTGTTKILYNSDKSFLDIARPNGNYYDPSTNTVRWANGSGAGIGAGTSILDQSLTSTFGRVSDRNNLAYFSPSFGGFNFGLRIATIGTNDSIRANNKDLGTGKESDTRLYDLAFNYNKTGLFGKEDAFYIGVGYQGNAGKGGDYDTGLTPTHITNKFNRIQLSTSYKFANEAKVSLLFGTGKDKWRSQTDAISASTGNVTSADNFALRNKMTYIQLGGILPFGGKFDVGANYARFTGKVSGTDYFGTTTSLDDASLNNKVTYDQLQVMLGYNLSKRTRAYTFIDVNRGKETGSYRFNNTALANGFDFTAKTRRNTLGVGLMHNF